MTLAPTHLTPSKVYSVSSGDGQKPVYLPEYAALLADPPLTSVTLLNTQGLPTKRVQFNNQSIEEFPSFWTVPAPSELLALQKDSSKPKGLSSMDCGGGQIYCTGANRLYHLEVEGGLDKGRVGTMLWEEVSIPIPHIEQVSNHWEYTDFGRQLAATSIGAYLYLVDSGVCLHKIFKPTGEIKWSKPLESSSDLEANLSFLPTLDPTSGLLFYVKYVPIGPVNPNTGIQDCDVYLCATNLSDGELAWKALIDTSTFTGSDSQSLVANGTWAALVTAEPGTSLKLVSDQQVVPVSLSGDIIAQGSFLPAGKAGEFAFIMNGPPFNLGIIDSQSGEAQISQGQFCLNKAGELQPYTAGKTGMLEGTVESLTAVASDPAGETYYLTFNSDGPEGAWIFKTRLIPAGSELKLEVLESYFLADVQVYGSPVIGPQGEIYLGVLPNAPDNWFLAAYQP